MTHLEQNRTIVTHTGHFKVIEGDWRFKKVSSSSEFGSRHFCTLLNYQAAWLLGKIASLLFFSISWRSSRIVRSDTKWIFCLKWLPREACLCELSTEQRPFKWDGWKLKWLYILRHKGNDNHKCVYISINQNHQVGGKAVVVPPDAARGWKRVGKNKGELSCLRRANSDAVDNETSVHDRGTVNA